MGMFSEITTFANIEAFVGQIKDELEKASSDETKAVLKRLGRWALTQFEWTTPEWAQKFSDLFKE
jgi:hypothetical protein